MLSLISVNNTPSDISSVSLGLILGGRTVTNYQPSPPARNEDGNLGISQKRTSFGTTDINRDDNFSSFFPMRLHIAEHHGQMWIHIGSTKTSAAFSIVLPDGTEFLRHILRFPGADPGMRLHIAEHHGQMWIQTNLRHPRKGNNVFCHRH
jgi:hypothetical protein